MADVEVKVDISGNLTNPTALDTKQDFKYVIYITLCYLRKELIIGIFAYTKDASTGETQLVHSGGSRMDRQT